ncbi:hypothetical protein AB0N06_14825 [Streptomyces sp. NPDC051020]|uniref:hypothetical protein n=1 Tax=Streptomyces sp. NPDC051020 TaxID=3155409 RepID=UPI0034144D9C
MSTERPDNDVTAPWRRRSPLAVASVVAAVLLAGGGSAYWAAADGGSGPRGSSARTLPLLALDEGASSPTAPQEGIAPGEPDPSGDGVVYRASGKLPDGPAKAAVHRAKGTVSAAEVTRLAKALGLEGTPRAEGEAWKVGSDGDGSGPVLRVNKQAPGTWSFARFGSGGTDNCRSTTACGGKDAAPGGTGSPVSENAAKAAAAPALKASGQDDAALDASQLMGSVRVVNANPVVGGLPTYGWATGIQVGPDGHVVGGSGQLKSLEKGAEYPVISADDALKQLNKVGRSAASRSGVGGCATSVPLEEGEPKPPAATCGTRTGAERGTTTVTVDKAVFGLAMRYVDGEQTLVPSWLFSVRPAAGGTGNTVAQVAVDPDSLAKKPSKDPRPDSGTGDASRSMHQLNSYTADGRTLRVTFWGGVCSTYAASATESANAVRVTITESTPDPQKVCIMIAKELTRTVTLDAPLGDRKVLDAAGGTVPRG